MTGSASTERNARAKRLPIVAGAKFRRRDGDIMTVDQVHPFGRGYEVVWANGTRSGIMNRFNLELLERIS